MTQITMFADYATETYPGHATQPRRIRRISAPKQATVDEGEIGKRDGIKDAEGGTDVRVLHELREAVARVCARMESFTADDVIEESRATPWEPRVLGAVMLWAQKQGFCLPTGNYRQSRHKECHKRPKMVWVSKIYKNG